jgi:hypothetical protein
MQKIIIFVVLLAASSQSASRADQASAALCSAKVREFVQAVDLLFTENPRSIEAYYEPIRNYLIGTRGCNVDEVIAISKTSKYFSELGEIYTEYVIVLENKRADVSFGLKKDTGEILVPAATFRFPLF